MADPRQVQEWLAGLEKERSSKIGETSGVGDLLNLLGLLKNPAMEVASQGAAGLDELTGANQSKFAQGVVSPAVKKQRNAAIAALQPAKTRRVDMIPERLSTPERTYGEVLRRGLPKKDIEGDDFFFEGSPRSKKYEILSDKMPKTGLTVTPGQYVGEKGRMLKVDAASRRNYEEMLAYANKVKQYHKAWKDREAMWDAKIKNPNAPRPPEDMPNHPQRDWQKMAKAPSDPAAVKQVSRALAAFYPNQNTIGGTRTSGIRQKLDLPTSAETPLPKLSEAAAQKARSQVTKWLDELVNSKTPKR